MLQLLNSSQGDTAETSDSSLRLKGLGPSSPSSDLGMDLHPSLLPQSQNPRLLLPQTQDSRPSPSFSGSKGQILLILPQSQESRPWPSLSALSPGLVFFCTCVSFKDYQRNVALHFHGVSPAFPLPTTQITIQSKNLKGLS